MCSTARYLCYESSKGRSSRASTLPKKGSSLSQSTHGRLISKLGGSQWGWTLVGRYEQSRVTVWMLLWEKYDKYSKNAGEQRTAMVDGSNEVFSKAHCRLDASTNQQRKVKNLAKTIQICFTSQCSKHLVDRPTGNRWYSL